MTFITASVDSLVGSLIDKATTPPEGAEDGLPLVQVRLGSKGRGGLEIPMSLNPKQVRFDWPKRFSRQDTQRGTVFHHFTNSKRRNNDVMEITITANTGLINPEVCKVEADRVAALNRLQTFHNLYALTQEEMVLADGTPNDFYMIYASQLFPVPITFHGFFKKVLSFSEEGSKPNSRDFTIDFTVTSIDPEDVWTAQSARILEESLGVRPDRVGSIDTAATLIARA